MTPGLSAGVCEALRARGLQTPVLFLTARDGLPDRLSGFHAGGDDYLNVNLGFGLTNTTYVTGALLAVLLKAQFSLKRYVPGVYWSAVVSGTPSSARSRSIRVTTRREAFCRWGAVLRIAFAMASVCLSAVAGSEFSGERLTRTSTSRVGGLLTFSALPRAALAARNAGTTSLRNSSGLRTIESGV